MMATASKRGFHGRDAELVLIRTAFRDRLAEGAEAVVIVEGAADIGKSRLLTEASSLTRSLGINSRVELALVTRDYEMA
jgi:hypothetical protein